METCYQILSKVLSDQGASGDMLYRELCRQVADQLSQFSKTNYKGVMKMLGKLYHEYSKNQNPELTRFLNEMMLKISQAVLGNTSKGQGKYYRLLSCHAKMLAAVTLSHAHQE